MAAKRVVSESSKEEFQYVHNTNNINSYNKVMTDEQLDTLRRQISAYGTICQQLVDMHRSITAAQHYHLPTGIRLGNIYCDPLMTSSGHKIAGRQRWTPTQAQLQILESIFSQGNGTPGKQKVKELTNELSQHGPISETNVYNWFQNRRARSKRKRSVGAVDSEAEGEVDSPKEKKSKVENFGPNEKSAAAVENINVQTPKISEDMYCFDSQLMKGDSIFEIGRGLRFSEGFDNINLFDSCPRMDYFLDKADVAEAFTHYQLDEEFAISG